MPISRTQGREIPVMSKSPNLDCFVPPKANGSLGTGTPMLTPIMPQNKDLVKENFKNFKRQTKNMRGKCESFLATLGASLAFLLRKKFFFSLLNTCNMILPAERFLL